MRKGSSLRFSEGALKGILKGIKEPSKEALKSLKGIFIKAVSLKVYVVEDLALARKFSRV